MISCILCGGAGSRLWPISREQHPKPFLRLPDGQSFFQKAVARGSSLKTVQEHVIITNQELHFKAVDELAQLPIAQTISYILEPFGRNTAPAILMAAFYTKDKYGSLEPMLTLPADHLIENQPEFLLAIERAEQLALQGKIVLFGIQPTAPKTGFGYIKTDNEDTVHFFEKPSQEKAQKYFDSQQYLWNAGIFLFTPQTILTDAQRFAPDLFSLVEDTYQKSKKEPLATTLSIDPQAFQHVPDISIDYALIEKSPNLTVVSCNFGWQDIGSWGDFCDLEQADPNGNRVSSNENTFLTDVTNCNIHSEGRLIAAIGLEDILVVDTEDALLVVDKSREQEVKDIYLELKGKDRDEYKSHRTVYRPWGDFTLLEVGPRFKIKRLVVKPGKSISLQKHYHRSEHWVVVSGMAEVTCGEKVFTVDTNESTYIKAGTTHRVANQGKIDLVIIEVQSGDYLEEDDIMRIEDAYGRV